MGRKVFTQETRDRVIKLLKDGHSGVEVQKMTGVSQQTISRIRKQLPDAELNRKKYFPQDLIKEWEALNRIGREYREKKQKRSR